MMVGTRAGASVTPALAEAIWRASSEPGVILACKADTAPVVTLVWGTGAWVASAICLTAGPGGETKKGVKKGKLTL